MIPVREALDLVLGETRSLGGERIGLLDALGRVLGEDVRSTRDVPAYANSAMDGYAVRHADVARVPSRLAVVGTAAAGGAAPPVGAGQAARIMTGAPIPPGADTVVRVEDTRSDGTDVIIETVAGKGSHIRHPGEDLRAESLVLRRGKALSPADLGLLASIGKTLVLAYARPRVAIVSTGNELVEADEAVGPGQVVNSNAYTLAAAVKEAGGEPVLLPIARDTLAHIREVLLEAATCDAVLSTGGVSVGEFDYVKQVMDEIGVKRLFWKVAQKPGKPLTFGTIGRRLWFGLPGNPVSSLVCFYLYARPALRRMMGHDAPHLPAAEAVLGADLRKAAGLTEFVRCRLERRGGALVATSTGSQSSGVLRSMSEGQALIVAPAEADSLAAGSTVRVILLSPEVASGEAPF